MLKYREGCEIEGMHKEPLYKTCSKTLKIKTKKNHLMKKK